MEDDKDVLDTLPHIDVGLPKGSVKLRDHREDAPEKADTAEVIEPEPEDPEMTAAREGILELAQQYRDLAREHVEKAEALERLAEHCSPRMLDVLAETHIDMQEAKWFKPSVPPMVTRLLRAWNVLRGKGR